MMQKFYPISPSLVLTKEYIDAGVKFLQIRLKDMPLEQVKENLKVAILYAKKHNAELVVNDFWQEALEFEADWVHLGQEDLDTADIEALKRAGIKIGLSTHDEAELNRALSYTPNYIALGPIYFTRLKAMKWEPQGQEKIKVWKNKIGNIPLVAIGGITLENAQNIILSGADSISVVTDISLAENRRERLLSWLKEFPML